MAWYSHLFKNFPSNTLGRIFSCLESNPVSVGIALCFWAQENKSSLSDDNGRAQGKGSNSVSLDFTVKGFNTVLT